MRKPVGVSTVLISGSRGVSDAEGKTIVVCDDGSTWLLEHPSQAWEELPPLPGTLEGEKAATP